METKDLRLLNVRRGSDGNTIYEELPGNDVGLFNDIDKRITEPMENVLLNVKYAKSAGEVLDILAVDFSRHNTMQTILVRDKACHKDNEADILYLNGNEKLWKSLYFDGLSGEDLIEALEEEDIESEGNIVAYIEFNNITLKNIPENVDSDLKDW